MPVCTACGRDNPDDARFCNACGSALARTPPREQRKVVTVVFCDVTGSTELGERLDPEALRALLARYFERMRAIVESHGGTVEKFVGDAVMAVFGVPTLHEDDALRACRAADEMRGALPGLGVAGRIGVATGEVVTGTEERLATGDAVNVAARLQQAAAPGESLLAAETLALVQDAVEVETVEPLALKGKAEPVPAFRLLAIRGERARRQGVAMVGRTRERALLQEVWQRSVAERSCQLFTILGSAGIGKSRLAAEFLAGLDATVVRGRCLSYGEGITYWPVVEILRQLLPERPAERLQALGLAPAGTSALLGLLDAEGGRPAPPGETAWAFRKLLEAAAAERPLVCVFDDVHWGEPAFLDLVEHVADLGRDAPLLLLCLARPELYDVRPGWAGGKLNATTVLIEPLSPVETDELIDRLGAVDPALRSRIRTAAGGNPLFVEEMLAIVRETATDVAVPPTIQALLAARIDGLAPAERSLLECGAVEGEVFHAGAARALAPDEPAPETLLAALVRRDLIRPARAIFRGEDAYRFRHILLRDAAYESMPKTRRVKLHVRYADWLQARENELVEADEILGHHLERAYRYLAELGQRDDGLAFRAGERLGAAGVRATARYDHRAAEPLLRRAFDLLPPERRSLRLWRSRAASAEGLGNAAEAQALMAEAETLARAQGDELGALRARIGFLTVSRLTSEARVDECRAVALGAIPRFERAGDDEALIEARKMLFWTGFDSLRNADAIAALEPVLAITAKSGLHSYELSTVVQLSTAHMFGPTPAPAALAFLDEHDVSDWTAYVRAQLLAMLGRFDEARAAARRWEEYAREFGYRLEEAAVGMIWFPIETLAGDPAAAEPALQRCCAMLRELCAEGYLSTEGAQLGLVLFAQGRREEAERWLGIAEEATAVDDVISLLLLGRLRTKLLASRGQHDEAERVAAETIALAEGTDSLFEHGMTLVDVAEAFSLGGGAADAAVSLHRAVELFERKQAPAAVALAQARLAALGAPV